MSDITIVREKVNSTTIKEIGFDSASNTLEVEFYGRVPKGSPKGTKPPVIIWRYQPVTEHAFNEMKSAESIGSYFAKHIKSNDFIDTQKLVDGKWENIK